jgi:RNA polymerase sigma-70 factor, ECF subfamily
MTADYSKNSHFFKLYNSVQVRLYSYLLTVVHNSSDAEDLLQETATVLLENFEQFQEGTSFGAWAIAIAKNKSLEFLRKNKKTRMIFDDSFYEELSCYAEQKSKETSHRSEALQFCSEKLSEKNRNLLSMRFRKDISIKKISQMTGCSLDSLYHRFSTIIRSLRQCMEQYITSLDAR